MRIIGGNLLKTLLLILMNTTHRYSLLLIPSIMMSPYQGGIHFGFPMYVKMDRNLENGAYIHNAAYGRLGIMMRIRIVNYIRNEADQ